MKRKEFEGKLRDAPRDCVARIESAPLPAFIAGIVLGVLLAVFWRAIVPLLIIVALILGGIWLFSDRDQEADTAEETCPTEDRAEQ